METLNFNITEENNNIRIDRYLAEQCPDLSRSYIQKLVKDGAVFVNNRQIKANYKVQPQDQVILTIPDMQVPDILPENIPLDILYEDQWLLVVNKPKDMVVHPSAGHMERNPCKRSNGTLWRTSFRHQRCSPSRNCPPYRQGYHRCTSDL